MVISNFELANIAKQHNIKLALQDIIIATQLDDLDYRAYKNLIINFGDNSHFVAMLIRHDVCFYFDSFGAQPIKEVYEYCKHNRLHLGFNTFIIQDINDTSCGLYCIALINYCNHTKARQLYDKCNEFINIFDDDTRYNKKILYNYLHNCGVVP